MKVKHNDPNLFDIKNLWQLIAYLFKYCKLEMVAVILALGMVGLIYTNVSYNSKDKLTVKPALSGEDVKDIVKSKLKPGK